MIEANKDIPLGIPVNANVIPHTDKPLMHEVNQPSEVAKAILWLSSDEASFITGEIMNIDGGQSLTSNNFGDYMEQV